MRERIEGDNCRRRKCKSSIYASAHCHARCSATSICGPSRHAYTHTRLNMHVYIYILYIYIHIYMWYNRTGIYVCIDLACISRDEARTMMHGRSTAHLPFPLSPIHAFFSLTRLLSMFHRSRDTKGKSAPEFQTRYSAEPTVIVYARARALTIN